MYNEINQAVKALREGGIIAYPTEGVFGLGCDPFNATAVLRLLKLKRRQEEKGLILIASSWSQVKNLVKGRLYTNKIIKQSGKKPITWVLSATKKVPPWVTGKFNSVAIRVTLHPVAKKLCQRFGGVIISTSANLEGTSPAKNAKEVRKQFTFMLDFVVTGPVGNLQKPTEIRDIETNKIIRA